MANCFFLGLYCLERFGSSINNLYFHNIWIHFPKHFQLFSFYDSSTELNESIMARIKRIIKYNSNRKESNSLKEALLRTQTEFNISRSQRDVKNRISKAFRDYQFRSFIVENGIYQKYYNEIAIFLNDLEMKYGSQYFIKEENLIFFMD